MREIVPENASHKFTKLDDCKNSIFLAGPCPRDNYEDDWRNEAVEILRKLKFKGDVLVVQIHSLPPKYIMNVR